MAKKTTLNRDKICLRPFAEDIRDTRRECQTSYSEQTTLDGRRSAIEAALEDISQLAVFLEGTHQLI